MKLHFCLKYTFKNRTIKILQVGWPWYEPMHVHWPLVLLQAMKCWEVSWDDDEVMILLFYLILLDGLEDVVKPLKKALFCSLKVRSFENLPPQYVWWVNHCKKFFTMPHVEWLGLYTSNLVPMSMLSTTLTTINPKLPCNIYYIKKIYKIHT